MRLKNLPSGSVGYICRGDLVYVLDRWEISAYAVCKPDRHAIFTVPIRRLHTMNDERVYEIENTLVYACDPWWVEQVGLIISAIMVAIVCLIVYLTRK